MKYIWQLIIISLVSTSILKAEDKHINYNQIIKIVENNNIKILDSILNKKELNAIETPNELPLIFYACSSSNLEMINYLLSKGANPNAINPYGMAVHWACEKGRMDIVSLLLENGLNANYESMEFWINQKENQQPNLIKMIVKKIKQEELNYKNYPFMEFTDPSDPLLLNACINYSRTKDYRLAKKILKQGANINLIDKRGFTALHHAIRNFNITAIKFLIDNGADVNQTVFSRIFSRGKIHSIFNNNLNSLHLLLFFIKRDSNFTEVKKAKALKIARILIDADVNLKLRTKEKNQTILEIAGELNFKELIKLISSN
jgi:ankyrin repeat protein